MPKLAITQTRSNIHRNPHQIGTLNALGLERDSQAIGGAGNHPGLGPALEQPGGSANVVTVVVGVENRRELQALGLQGGNHRLCHRRIHHRRLLTVLDHKHIVVAEHWDQAHLQGFWQLAHR